MWLLKKLFWSITELINNILANKNIVKYYIVKNSFIVLMITSKQPKSIP